MTVNITTLGELIKESHECALQHGWWDNIKPKPILEKIALIHSELSEALEELRKGQTPTAVYHEEGETKMYVPYYPMGKHKPEGVPVELADAVIRVADLAGRYEFDLGNPDFKISNSQLYSAQEIEEHKKWAGDPIDGIDYLHNLLTPASRAMRDGSGLVRLSGELGFFVLGIYAYCMVHSIDLPGAINMKCEYNRSRSYRHGGKSA